MVSSEVLSPEAIGSPSVVDAFRILSGVFN